MFAICIKIWVTLPKLRLRTKRAGMEAVKMTSVTAITDKAITWAAQECSTGITIGQPGLFHMFGCQSYREVQIMAENLRPVAGRE